MVTLELDNIYLSVLGMTKDQEFSLWKVLSFKVEIFGVQEVRYRHLFNRVTKKTYAGLAPHVMEFCDEWGIKYKLVDLREKPEQNESYSLVKEINGNPLQMRPYQKEIVDRCTERETIQAATGAGKAMPLDTPILTPDGFIYLKDIHVGDMVIDGLGKPAKVIGEYPQGEKEEWLVTFQDGSTARCCNEHLWKFKTPDSDWKVASLGQILDEYDLEKTSVSIPICDSLLVDESMNFFYSNKMKNMIVDSIEKSEEKCICFSIKNKHIAESIRLLALWLGYRASVTFNEEYHVKVLKLDSLRIVNVKKTGNTLEMKCIAVDSPDHTFICGNFIVTHNTFIMAALIAKYKVSPICVFADKISLCSQLKSEFEKFLGEPVGFIGDGIYDPKDITVMSIQSADEDLCKQAKMILIDECLPYNAQISMSDGSVKKIGDIVRDKDRSYVTAYNTQEKRLEDCKIINFIERPIGERKMYSISIESEDKSRLNLMCTHNHKIWVEEEQNYIYAEQLKTGTHVVIFSNLGTVFGTIKTAANVFSRIEYVYDITVEKNHNFFANGILVSNCHHVPSDTCLSTACKCENAYYRIGVSATPWREDNAELLIEGVLNKRKPENDISASKLIRLGYLVKPVIYFVPIDTFVKGRQYQKLYEKAIVDNIKRNKIICKIAYQLYKRNRVILILVKYVRHGEFLLDKLRHLIGDEVTTIKVNDGSGTKVDFDSHNIEFLSGDNKTFERTAILEAVTQGVCKIVISSAIFDEGIDCPRLDTLILAGGGKSSTRAYQRIGRILRNYPGKTKAFVFDFEDATPVFKKHAKVRRRLYEAEEEWDIKDFNVTV